MDKSENFAQCQQNLARMYPCVSVIFRNSAVNNFNLQVNGLNWSASWLKNGIIFFLIGCFLWPFIRSDRISMNPRNCPFARLRVQLKSQITKWTLVYPSEPKWNVMNRHEPSWTVMNRHEPSWTVMNRHEPSWIVMNRHESSWIVMNRLESSWMVMNRINCLESSWFVMNFDELL